MLSVACAPIAQRRTQKRTENFKGVAVLGHKELNGIAPSTYAPTSPLLYKRIARSRTNGKRLRRYSPQIIATQARPGQGKSSQRTVSGKSLLL